MLQQTQMDRVVVFFNRWVARYPDITALSRASEDDILKSWEGLGYYSRARNILKTARRLSAEHAGRLPADHAVLLDLPGIGPYTAGAIMSLAFNEDYPIVDANIERLFARFFRIEEPVKNKTATNFIWQKAKELIPTGQARYFNQALMELGALVCLPGNPHCSRCPLTAECRARAGDMQQTLPVQATAGKIIPISMASGVLLHRGRIFIQKRLKKDIWSNLWEFPGGCLEEGETPEQALQREFLEETELRITELEKIRILRHSYTNYRVTLHCYYCRLQSVNTEPVLHAAQQYRWATREELLELPFPSPHRKLIGEIYEDLVGMAE